MKETEIALIKKKSLSGVVALTTRTFILQIIAFGSTFILTVLLSPEIFGVFYVVSAVISFLTYFSDIGLAAALIQKKGELSREDLVTTFTIQQILVLMIVVCVLVGSKPITAFYGLSEDGRRLLLALGVSFFLSSLKTIPTVLLERRLEFKLLVIPQIIETVAFYAVAVFLAWRHFGITSFTWAVLARAVTGLAAIYLVQPWKIAFGISRAEAKKLMTFGIPFQANSLIALVKDDLMTIFLGKVLPFAEVGYIGWAKKWAEVPLRLVVDSIVKVTFPAFSRIQHAPALLGLAIERTLYGLALTIFPVTVAIISFGPSFVAAIPRYGKWEPALTSLLFLGLASAVSSLSVPLTNTLNAVGRIKTTLFLMVMWTVLTWILTVTGIRLFGFNGYAVASFALTATVGIVVYLVRQVAPFPFIRTVAVPFGGALAQWAWYRLVLSVMPLNPVFIVLSVLSGILVYGAVVYLFNREKLLKLVTAVRESL